MNRAQELSLENKVTFLMETLANCFGVSIEEELVGIKASSLTDTSSPILLSSYLNDIEDFDVTLYVPNQVGSERGYFFKKGTQKQHKGQSTYEEKTILCKLKDGNKKSIVMIQKTSKKKQNKN